MVPFSTTTNATWPHVHGAGAAAGAVLLSSPAVDAAAAPLLSPAPLPAAAASVFASLAAAAAAALAAARLAALTRHEGHFCAMTRTVPVCRARRRDASTAPLMPLHVADLGMGETAMTGYLEGQASTGMAIGMVRLDSATTSARPSSHAHPTPCTLHARTHARTRAQPCGRTGDAA